MSQETDQSSLEPLIVAGSAHVLGQIRQTEEGAGEPLEGVVDDMIVTNNLLSPTLNNLSPNIMGRTAKFAVSNKHMNKRDSRCSGSGADQGQGTSSSTKLAASRLQ